MQKTIKYACLASLTIASLMSVAVSTGALKQLATDYPSGILYWNEETKQIDKQLPDEFVFSPKELVGRGGFGAVFSGSVVNKDKSEKLVAVKSMATSDINAREILNIVLLQGLPNVAQFYACAITKDKIYIVSELLHKDLEHEPTRLTIKTKHLISRTKLYQSLTSTLMAVHARKMVHWDLKPKNLMVDSADAGKILIIDFGVACPTNKPIITGSTYWWSPEMWALLDSYNSMDQNFDLNRNWSVLSTMNDAWALIFTLADLEFPSIKSTIENYPCWHYKRNRMCVSEVLRSMDNYYEQNKEKWVEECGEAASLLFYRAFMKSLRFDLGERVDLKGFNRLLGKTIELCDAHNNNKANPTKRGILKPNPVPLAHDNETSNAVRKDINKNAEIISSYSSSVVHLKIVEGEISAPKENEQPDEDKTNTAASSFDSPKLGFFHQSTTTLVTNTITELSVDRETDDPSAQQADSETSERLPVLTQKPKVSYFNLNDPRNYMVFVDFSPNAESDLNDLKLNDASILKGRGIVEANNPGLLRV
jgi:serine/threonine protein kinase